MKFPKNLLKLLILGIGIFIVIDGIVSIFLQLDENNFFLLGRIIRSIVGIILIILAFREDEKIVIIK